MIIILILSLISIMMVMVIQMMVMVIIMMVMVMVMTMITQERLLLSVLPRHVAMEMKADIAGSALTIPTIPHFQQYGATPFPFLIFNTILIPHIQFGNGYNQ